jgi:hypothetical protein
VRIAGRAGATAGETVHVAWEAAATHWFDLSSNCRIEC